MPRTASSQTRVKGSDLVRALHAAAAFTHADKKSHRHRIHLATAPVDDAQVLLVAGGSPTRVLVANVGAATGDELRLDLTPAAAGLIVKLFTGAGDVALKHDGKTLTVIASDALFDNQRIEVRTPRIDPRSDAVRIAATAVNLVDEQIEYVAISHDNTAAIAKAAKALGLGPMLTPVGYHDSHGVRVTFGKAAIGYVRATPAVSALSYWDAATAGGLPAIGSPWYADHITLGHILDGVPPLNVTSLTGNDLDGDAADEGVDLDAPVEATELDSEAGAA